MVIQSRDGISRRQFGAATVGGALGVLHAPHITYQTTIPGFGLPANVASWENLLLVPELLGRVSLLDSQLQVVATLGDDAERIKADKSQQIRQDAQQWLTGKFVHPHDACFDHTGNIYVAEWVSTGRVTQLKKLA